MFTIIGISGIRSNNNPVWKNLQAAFQHEFPDAEFVVEEEPYCEVYHISRFRQFILRLRQKYDDGRTILLVGHSNGGLVACALAYLLRNSRVIGIVTIATPHRIAGHIYPTLMGVPRDPGVPIITFQIKPDRVVPWGTRHPKSLWHGLIESTVPRTHLMALVTDARHAYVIARKAKTIFSRT